MIPANEADCKIVKLVHIKVAEAQNPELQELTYLRTASYAVKMVLASMLLRPPASGEYTQNSIETEYEALVREKGIEFNKRPFLTTLDEMEMYSVIKKLPPKVG